MALMNPEIPKPGVSSGASTGSNGKHQLQRLLPRHFKMIELHLAGLTNRAIAETLDCTAQSVGIVLNSPIVRKEVQQKMTDKSHGSIAETVEAHDSKVVQILEKSSERAAYTLQELMEHSDDDSIKLRASTSILDRVIGKPDSKNAGEGVQLKIEIDAKHATLLMLALNESKEFQRENVQSAANGQDADTSEDLESDVHQETVKRPWLGYRKAQTQAPDERRKDVTNTAPDEQLKET